METSTWTSPLLPKTPISSLPSSPSSTSGRPAITAASVQSTAWAWRRGTTSTTVKPARLWLWWVTSRPCWTQRASSTHTRLYPTIWNDRYNQELCFSYNLTARCLLLRLMFFYLTPFPEMRCYRFCSHCHGKPQTPESLQTCRGSFTVICRTFRMTFSSTSCCISFQLPLLLAYPALNISNKF